MIDAEGHDIDIDGDCWATCPACKAEQVRIDREHREAAVHHGTAAPDLAPISPLGDERRRATETEREALLLEIEAHRRLRDEALKILDTQSGSDLLDACRQVKQVAISEADNSEKAEAEIARLKQSASDTERLRALAAAWRAHAEMLPRLYTESDRGELRAAAFRQCADELEALLVQPDAETKQS